MDTKVSTSTAFETSFFTDHRTRYLLLSILRSSHCHNIHSWAHSNAKVFFLHVFSQFPKWEINTMAKSLCPFCCLCFKQPLIIAVAISVHWSVLPCHMNGWIFLFLFAVWVNLYIMISAFLCSSSELLSDDVLSRERPQNNQIDDEIK